MKPNEIATDISDLVPVGTEIVAMSTNFTYSFGRMDDSNTWD